ncbi:MAG: D-tyrosyl-tRNA(Tyr) deacylase [Alphaproteobacteria bacterium]|nr:D-tyrosyl-tRNA(Tyr) deacylase [Alphaproteobacteria bacterium]
MRAVVQRVLASSVSVDGQIVGQIGKGFNVLLGVGQGDGQKQVEWLAEKIAHLRVFEDENAKMNLSLKDINGSALVISQFTLYGNCEKGRRPSFTDAAHPTTAQKLYKDFIEELKKYDIPVETGIFQADMKVEITNDGPVTMIIETPQKVQEKEQTNQTENYLGLTEKEMEKFNREAQMLKRNIALRKQQKENKNG